MSLKTQAKVLRALDEHRFEPVGAAEWIQVDVRVVASTNKNLEEEIERGNFREDLFYRLNVIPFHVPPLRERIEDVRLLADHFLREFTTAYGRKPKELTRGGAARAGGVSLAGQRARAAQPDGADRHHESAAAHRRAPHPSRPHPPRRLRPPLERFGSLHEVREAAERDYILKKLDEAKGNVTRAADLLGLERQPSIPQDEGSRNRGEGMTEFCYSREGFDPERWRSSVGRASDL